MQPYPLTPNLEQRNTLQLDNFIAHDNTPYTIEYQMSDLAFQQFQGFTQRIFNIPITDMLIMSKQFDKPLGLFSRIGAKLLGIKQQHQFVMIHTERLLMTIDFYVGSRVRVRVGDRVKVLGTEMEEKRKQAEVVKTEEGLEWRRHFGEGQLFVKDVLDCLKNRKLERGFSKISYRGAHFSRKFWGDVMEIVSKRQ